MVEFSVPGVVWSMQVNIEVQRVGKSFLLPFFLSCLKNVNLKF